VLTVLSALLLFVSVTLGLFVFRPGSPRYGPGVGKDTRYGGEDPSVVKYLRDFQVVYLLGWLAAGLAVVASAWQLQQAG
jgi:hypothetical protein